MCAVCVVTAVVALLFLLLLQSLRFKGLPVFAAGTAVAAALLLVRQLLQLLLPLMNLMPQVQIQQCFQEALLQDAFTDLMDKGLQSLLGTPHRKLMATVGAS